MQRHIFSQLYIFRTLPSIMNVRSMIAEFADLKDNLYPLYFLLLYLLHILN